MAQGQDLWAVLHAPPTSLPCSCLVLCLPPPPCLCVYLSVLLSVCPSFRFVIEQLRFVANLWAWLNNSTKIAKCRTPTLTLCRFFGYFNSCFGNSFCLSFPCCCGCFSWYSYCLYSPCLLLLLYCCCCSFSSLCLLSRNFFTFAFLGRLIWFLTVH